MIKNLLSTTVIILGLVFTMNTQASDYGPVAAKETLWNIASRNRPSYEVSTQQMMLAIRRANPNAFKTSNINSLRSGVVLHIPNLAEINKANKSTALKAAKQQNTSWRSEQKKVIANKKSSLRSSRKELSSASYKRYYKASQRELRKLQKRLKREQRRVRKLKHELAQAGVSISTTGESGNIAVLQDEVSNLEKIIQEKDAHIKQLNNMKLVAAETIKKLSATNEVYFNKLKTSDPDFAKTQNATSGFLELQGIDQDATAVQSNNNKQTNSLATGGSGQTQKIAEKDNGFIIVIAVLALLFAFALLWRVYSQYLAKKQALKSNDEPRSEEPKDKKGDFMIANRQEPSLNT